MAGKITHATKDTFNDEIKEGYVFVDFWAEWCGPCKMLAPIFEELSEEWGDKVKFIKLDTDENPEVAQNYGIMGIPTLMLFKDGQVVNRVSGAYPKPFWVDFLTTNTQS